jgi:hypothetical protein
MLGEPCKTAKKPSLFSASICGLCVEQAFYEQFEAA